MNGNSRQQVIPPARLNVKAGFVVYSHNDQERKIIILDKGELAAVDNTESPRKVMFTMQPGDLVGVAALLEREPFRYDLEATEDSEITVVSEDCMESELNTENLIRAKGFEEVIVSMHNGSVNVIVDADALTDEQVAQILDIVLRQTGETAENIKVSTAQ